MNKPLGEVLEVAIFRHLNTLKLCAGQAGNKVKHSLADHKPFTKCVCCQKSLTQTEVYGKWGDYCIDCYLEKSENNPDI